MCICMYIQARLEKNSENMSMVFLSDTIFSEIDTTCAFNYKYILFW